MMKTALAAALLVVAPALAARADAGDDDAHHRGFFLRMHLGGGYLNSSATDAGTALRVKGGAGSFSVAVGGAVARDLHLYGELMDSVASSPTYSVNGTSAVGTNTSYGLVGLGPGVNYYFMPVNIYLSGSLLLARLAADNGNGSTGNSDWGLAGKFQAGKEWWVSENWGLGIAGMLLAGSNPAGGGSKATFTTWSGALLFSATYN